MYFTLNYDRDFSIFILTVKYVFFLRLPLRTYLEKKGFSFKSDNIADVNWTSSLEKAAKAELRK